MKIKKYLLEKGFKPHLNGFNFLVTAIELCQRDKMLLSNVTKTLYPIIAEKYNKTSSKVVRAINYLLIVAKVNQKVSEFIATAVIELEN